MVVLGNLPSKRYVEAVYTDTINVIHEDSWSKRVKRKLKLLGEPVQMTKYSHVHLVGGKRIILFNADGLPALKELLMKEVPTMNLKFASTYLNYVWSRAFSNFNYTDVTEWVDATRLFGKLHRDYFTPSIQPELHARAVKDSEKLFFIAGDYPLITPTMNTYKNFDMYTRESVLEACSLNNSIYWELLKAPTKSSLPIFRDKLDLQKWCALDDNGRVEAVLERVYSDIANEIVFRDLCITNIEYTIMEAIMNAANNQGDAFFSMFIRINFDRIMSEADLGIDEWVTWAIANKEFKEV